MVVLTQDWHPAGHISFISTHIRNKDAELYKLLKLADGREQIMWPDHGIQNTKGAELHVELHRMPSDVIIKKGQSIDVDSYSAFYDNEGGGSTGLTDILRRAHITDVYLVGVAYDFCVGWSAQDALKEGFKVWVVDDACRGVNPQTTAQMRLKLQELGVTLVNSTVLLEKREDKRQSAALYLEEHKISSLFETLCTSLVYHKPADPRAFLVQQLQKYQREKNVGKLSVISPDDFTTVFEMMDPVNRGLITSQQATQALLQLGLVKDVSELKGKVLPDSSYNLTQFKNIATSLLYA